jgi:hypothetical protein
MNQNFDRFTVKIDSVNHTVTLKGLADSTMSGTIGYQRPTPDRLVLDGDFGGKRLQLVMTRHDLEKFFLVSRSQGLHWVQEFPINR